MHGFSWTHDLKEYKSALGALASHTQEWGNHGIAGKKQRGVSIPHAGMGSSSLRLGNGRSDERLLGSWHYSMRV